MQWPRPEDRSDDSRAQGCIAAENNVRRDCIVKRAAMGPYGILRLSVVVMTMVPAKNLCNNVDKQTKDRRDVARNLSSAFVGARGVDAIDC